MRPRFQHLQIVAKVLELQNSDYSKRGVKSQIDLKKQNISQKHAHSDQYSIICDLYHRITNSKSRCIKYIYSQFEYYSALIVLAPKSSR